MAPFAFGFPIAKSWDAEATCLEHFFTQLGAFSWVSSVLLLFRMPLSFFAAHFSRVAPVFASGTRVFFLLLGCKGTPQKERRHASHWKKQGAPLPVSSLFLFKRPWGCRSLCPATSPSTSSPSAPLWRCWTGPRTGWRRRRSRAKGRPSRR